MEVIILESSCSSSNKISNSEWETVFNTDYILNDGDAIQLKNAFVNVNSLSGSNIVINQDITLKMTFGYYIVNGLQFLDINYSTTSPSYKYYLYPYFLGSGDIPEGSGVPEKVNMYDYLDDPPTYYREPTDFNTYVYHSYNYNGGNPIYSPIINQVEYTLKKGEYTPQQIAEIITQKFSTINNKSLQGIEIEVGGSSEIFYWTLGSGSKLLVPYGYKIESPIFYAGDDFVFVGSYDKDTDMRAVPQFQIKFLNPEDAGDIPFVTDYSDPVYYVGTNQFSLDYDDISQSFSFSFLHMPLTNPNDGTISNIICNLSHEDFISENSNKVISPTETQSKSGGIFLVDLEPKWFWEQLGFDLNEILVDISNGVDINEVIQKTTDQQLGLNTLPNIAVYAGSNIVNSAPITTADPAVPLPKLVYMSDSNVLPLKARNTYSSSNSGYYYIKAQFGISNMLNDGKTISGDLMGIVSKQFTLNDFVTGFSDSSITYVHSGQPCSLSSLKISVLDKNKNVVDNLSPNSTVFFQLLKSNSQQINVQPKNVVTHS